MIVGFLFISLLTATATTAFAINLGMSAWFGLIVFPGIGSVTLLGLAMLLYMMRNPTLTARGQSCDDTQEHHATV